MGVGQCNHGIIPTPSQAPATVTSNVHVTRTVFVASAMFNTSGSAFASPLDHPDRPHPRQPRLVHDLDHVIDVLARLRLLLWEQGVSCRNDNGKQ
jgi:hypothetical protein